MRIFLFAALLMAAALAPAQNPWDQGATFVRGAWEKVKTQGPVAAEAAVRATPARFKQVQKQVVAAQKQVTAMIKNAKLEEKRNLALQLWEIRGSLDLMALLNPDTLEALTGVDATMLRKLRAETAKLEALVQRFGR